MHRSIVIIAHDIRSTHNVGSLLRTCEGLGVDKVFISGYTPYPPLESGDERLPHIAQKLGRQIHKTALDAEQLIAWEHVSDIYSLLDSLKVQGYRVTGLEQSSRSVSLPDYQPHSKTALLLGREVEGIAPELLALCDDTVEIPMFGHKESFNVIQAAAMALYQLRLR